MPASKRYCSVLDTELKNERKQMGNISLIIITKAILKPEHRAITYICTLRNTNNDRNTRGLGNNTMTQPLLPHMMRPYAEDGQFTTIPPLAPSATVTRQIRETSCAIAPLATEHTT